MTATKAYAAHDATSPLGPFDITRREVGEHDILIEISYCGVCHSDIHQVRDEWGGSIFPMVPGHEIVGKVTRIGKQVKKLQVGDLAGVGCMVNSCGTCHACQQTLEQFCERGAAFTYNGTELDRKTPTYGGYSTQIVVDERFTLKLSPKVNLATTAPLLCAGITTYSPLRRWKVGKGTRVGVVGLGGLGHMGVKLAASMGAEVTVLSHSKSKESDARRLGAHAFTATSDETTFKKLHGHFDFLLNTISAQHDVNSFLELLRVNGTMVMVGVPPQPLPVHAFSVIGGNKNLAGSLIGGIAETQEMLDYCARHEIGSEVELIPVQKINEAYERMLRGDVRYRFVIDIQSLRG